MTDDIHLAFAHPMERSAATQSVPELDRISVRDHVVEVDIGAFQSERGVTQRVGFNIVVELHPLGPVDDDVDRILSYDRVTEAIQHELEAERLNLLETLAERIADRILLEPQAERVFVRIEKLDRGPGALGVEIVRRRRFAPRAAHMEDVPHPRVVYLSNEAIHSGYVSNWLDQLTAGNAPILLCVGMSHTAAPDANHKMAQRRIDLLAIEQNAWVLAGRDDRCVVVATRTELDWAMKHDQISVWAPSKLYLDAVEKPDVAPQNSVALTVWFAEQLQAQDMIVIGDDAPETAACPVRSVPIAARIK